MSRMDRFWLLVATWVVISFAAGLASGYRSPQTQHHIHAARGLGAREWRVFWRIGLPLSLRRICYAAGLIAMAILAAWVWL